MIIYFLLFKIIKLNIKCYNNTVYPNASAELICPLKIDTNNFFKIYYILGIIFGIGVGFPLLFKLLDYLIINDNNIIRVIARKIKLKRNKILPNKILKHNIKLKNIIKKYNN